jgi:hypothetical protein
MDMRLDRGVYSVCMYMSVIGVQDMSTAECLRDDEVLSTTVWIHTAIWNSRLEGTIEHYVGSTRHLLMYGMR